MLGEYLLLLLAVFLLIRSSLGIDCYVCSSTAGNDQLCDDPFDPITHPLSKDTPAHLQRGNGSFIYLQRNCFGARKSRLTAFPATACLKLAGIFSISGESLVIRACALDGGSLTSDTEIVRQNHCGGFFINDKHVNGCLEACFTDGCNSSSHLQLGLILMLTTVFICLFGF